MQTTKAYKFLTILCCLLFFTGLGHALAQEHGEGEEEGEVETFLTSASKNAIFSNSVNYKFEVKNTYARPQEGTVGYCIFDRKGDTLKKQSISVKVPAKGSSSYNFDIPGLKSGFYKVHFLINTTDYDDTTRKAFGVRPEEIKSTHLKPVDFDKFWAATLGELGRVVPQFKVTELPATDKSGNRKGYQIQMRSLDGILINAYLTVPKSTKKNKKFPVLLGLPGYQVSVAPLYGDDEDLAIMTLDVRGQGLSRDVIHTSRDEYIFHHIEDKDKYVMRGTIMDCVRAVDFIMSRPELDGDRIIASGGSMGGFLAIALASLDKRVKLCATQNPIMSDVRNLEGQVEWPIDDIQKYIKTQPGLTFEKVLSVLDYFDTKNFASNLKCETLLGIGLLDNLVPPANAYAVYNNIPGKKHIIVFKDLAHEIGQEYTSYNGRWLRDNFGLF